MNKQIVYGWLVVGNGIFGIRENTIERSNPNYWICRGYELIPIYIDQSDADMYNLTSV